LFGRVKINVRYTVRDNWMCDFNCRRIYCYFYAARKAVTPLQNQTTKLKITKKVKSTLRLLLCLLNFSLPDRRAHGHRDYLIWEKIFNNDRKLW